NPDMKAILNEKIKLRENFRPFAPGILAEEASKYFELHAANYDTMMVTARALDGVGAEFPSVVHEDGTSRVQLVDENSNPDYYRLLKTYYELTGCPMLINTSFNVRGEPMVESAEDALRCFVHTDMDLLVLENYILRKDEQPADAVNRIPLIRFTGD